MNSTMRVSSIYRKKNKNYPTLKNLSNLISIAGKGKKIYAHVERCVEAQPRHLWRGTSESHNF